MIGVKTACAVGFAAFAIVIAWVSGALDGAYLASLSRSACLAIGAFTAFATALLVHLWHPWRQSKTRLGLAGLAIIAVPVGDEGARELPGWAQSALLASVFLCIGLGAFDSQATTRLTELPAAFGDVSLTAYCPDPDEVAAAREEPEKEPEPQDEVQGCALIKRAYDLGYTDDLGPCAPKPPEEAEAEAEEAVRSELCTLRRPDEPLFHYAWRVTDERLGELTDFDLGDEVARGRRDFSIKLGYLDALYSHQSNAVAATPHASHHLFTNLPDPDPTSWIAGLLASKKCSGDYEDMELELAFSGDRAASKVVAHAFGHLLFNNRFGTPPGNCREYHIHWDANADVCERLADDPTGVLDGAGALEPVRDVLDRHRSRSELRQLAAELGEEQKHEPLPYPGRVVSFQCLIVGDGEVAAARSLEVVVDGYHLTARELRAPELDPAGAAQLDAYQLLARLLAGGSYGGPVEDEDDLARVAATPPAPEDLAAPGFALARLEHVRESDPFLGAGWPLDDAELAEVYPFHYHLDNFIGAFRRRYRAQRGRL